MSSVIMDFEQSDAIIILNSIKIKSSQFNSYLCLPSPVPRGVPGDPQCRHGYECNQLHYVMSCYVMLCYVMLCYVMLCYVMICYVMLCYVMLCYVMLCYVMLCYVMLGYVRL